MSFEAGSRIGDYEVAGVLGTGGMGKVYKVRNTISDRVEAMKVLLPDLTEKADLESRFLREIKLLATLSHPNIAGLHTALRVENQLLMIMELVEGTTVAQRLQKGPLSLQEAIDYTCQVLSALSYAHAQGIIHRDIKPANMMVTPSGVVKLMDFGIAKTAGYRLTMTGTTVGSLYYMSPEQIKAEALDGRADLYSLGVSLYEIVTGKRPFEDTSDFNVMVAHLQKAPVPPIQVEPNLPQVLNEIIMLAMAKDPAQRFQTADAFRTALGSARSTLGFATGAPARPAAAVAGAPVLGKTVPSFDAFPGGSQPPGSAPVALRPTATCPGSPLAGAPRIPAPAAAIPAVPLAGEVNLPPPVMVPPPVSERAGPAWLREPIVPPKPEPSSSRSPATPVAGSSGKNYRGLYMTAGALVALLVIVLGTTQLPNWRKARAGSKVTAQGTPVQQSLPAPPRDANPTAPGPKISEATVRPDSGESASGTSATDRRLPGQSRSRKINRGQTDSGQKSSGKSPAAEQDDSGAKPDNVRSAPAPNGPAINASGCFRNGSTRRSLPFGCIGSKYGGRRSRGPYG
jgi:eukaryotic-like serine/threonine-protein kinase